MCTQKANKYFFFRVMHFLMASVGRKLPKFLHSIKIIWGTATTQTNQRKKPWNIFHIQTMLQSHLHHDCFAIKIKMITWKLEDIFSNIKRRITALIETYSRAVMTVVWTTFVFRTIFRTSRAFICEPRKHELKNAFHNENHFFFNYFHFC